MTLRKTLMREQFARLALEHDDTLDLTRGAALIAAEDDEALNLEALLATIEAMGRVAAERIGPERRVEVALTAIAEYIHRDIGLIGDRQTYYDPRNSFLHEVLARKKGIPITLAVIYLAVGRAAGLPLVGVSFPAHFLIGAYAAPPDGAQRPDWFLDPFRPTPLLDVAACRELFVRLGGTPSTFRERLLMPASNRRILMRMLTNLKMVYAQTGEPEKSIAAIDRILLLDPHAVSEYRDRGALHMQLDLYALALGDFEHYLAEEPVAEERPSIEAAVASLRQRIAMLH